MKPEQIDKDVTLSVETISKTEKKQRMSEVGYNKLSITQVPLKTSCKENFEIKIKAKKHEAQRN